MNNISDPVAFAETFWSIQLKKSTRDEYVGPCPFCQDGEDRFHVWQEAGNYWCRMCGIKGFLNQLDKKYQPSQAAILEARLRHLERKQQEQERRLSALEYMAKCQDHLHYHNLLTEPLIDWWHNEGINQDSILSYKLGYCPHCPTDSKKRSSYTIPVINGNQLQNIRHRLVDADDGDKYRPHKAGLGTQLFNADFLSSATRDIAIVEGAKKSIVLDQNGIPSVAIMGKRSFQRKWLEWFKDIETIHVILDPDAKESAERLAAFFGKRGRIVNLPVKPDDFFYLYGGTVADFESYLKLARPIRRGSKHD